MKRRAKFKTIKWIHTRALCYEINGYGLARFDTSCNIITRNGKSVCGIHSPFKIRNVEDHALTLFNLYMLRFKMAADGGHVNIYSVSFSDNFPFGSCFCTLRLSQRIPPNLRINFPSLQLVCLHNLSVMRLAVSNGHVIKQFHLIPSSADVYKLKILVKKRACIFETRSEEHTSELQSQFH